jgi:DNA topoisomerase-1
MTSTLQQEAGRKLRFSAQRTMRVAQSLYENGYITYMRTDSVTLSGEAIGAARAQVERLYGHEYLPEKPRHYTSKARNAQEAHEAIRPAGDRFRTPQELGGTLEADQLRLYELIWKRTLASQMKDAHGVRSTVRIEAETAASGRAVLAANGKVLTFAGFLRAYVEGSDDPSGELADQEKVLPKLAEGDELDALEVLAGESTTQPAARHTEATLVKELEARGIGRPSTYATIIQTIQDRGYVWHKGPALVPSFTAFAVTQLLERHLPELVDYDFTARMEDELDRIAAGQLESVPWLHGFYFGPDDGNGGDSKLASAGLQAMLEASNESAAPQEVSRIELPGELDGQRLVVRVGRYGPYLEIGDDSGRRLSVPPDLPPDELTPAKVRELAEQVEVGARELGTDPATGQTVVLKSGRFGPYVQLGEANGNGGAKGKGRSKGAAKPRMASLWPDMSPDALDLEQALMLLSYPREVGTHPETGTEITAHYGRYGPFLKMGDDNRSLDSYEKLADITLDEAVEVFKQPKGGRRRGAASVLAELGSHPESGAEVQVKDGRWGPYVTDGTVNATIPKGTDPASVTLAQAVELLAARERKMGEKGSRPGARRGGRRRSTGKKKS